MVVRGAIALVLLILLGYGLMESWPLIAGPSLTLTSPQDGATIPDGVVTVSGTTKRVGALYVDGAPLLIDEKGDFSRIIVLPRGGAILTLVATDRFGRTITKQESLYVP
jgi:hypothetical protein